MSEDFAQALIPVCSLIGIGFALIQWFLVSRIRVATGRFDNSRDHLIEEDEQEEVIDSVEVVNKCAEIQNAISIGETSLLSSSVLVCESVFPRFALLPLLLLLVFGSVQGRNSNQLFIVKKL